MSPDQARDDWPDYAEIRRRRAERRALYVAGMPDIVHLSLPMETPVVRSREVAQIPLSEYEAELRTDASYSYGDQVVGAAWQLVIGGIEAPVRVSKRRYGKGPVFAEMTAVGLGLMEAQSKGINRLVLKTDSQWCAQALLGLVRPQLHYMIRVCTPALDAAGKFSALAVVHTRTRNIKHVDHAARRAARAESARVKGVQDQREARARAALVRARGVTLGREEGEYVADAYAHVRLDPPNCTCKGWTLRWAGVPLEGKRARRIPCKHLTAVALAEGIDDPSALLELSRRAEA